MKLHLLSAIAAAAMAVGTSAYAGPVIIDGTDSGDHGSFNGAVNVGGWQYMQRALENLGAAVNPLTARVVNVIGTSLGTGAAYNSINSAFALSNLVAGGWSIVYHDGVAAINAFMGGLSIANTGILYLSTAGLVTGDMSQAELAEVNANSGQINTFVSNAPGNAALGGALFAQGEAPSAISFNWLSALIPGIAVTDVGAGGVNTPITLTPAGSAAFLGNLTNADVAGARPWHNYFSGNLGGLSVLGVAPDGTGASRNVILGGGVGTVFQCGQQGQPACPTPEPGSMLLVATAGLALLGLRRRRQSK